MQLPEQINASTGMGTEPRYWPISAYGVIGDCRTAALVGPDGSIDWCCLPHFDSPAIFCRLLDADKGGFFRLSPLGGAHSTMAYLPGTNILETTFESSTGRLRLLDYMPIRNRVAQAGAQAKQHEAHLNAGYERDLGNDVAAAHRLQREATCLEGSVELEVVVKATFDYARQPAQIERQPLTNAATGAILSAGGRYLALAVCRLPAPAAHVQDVLPALTQEGDTLRLRVTLQAGERLVAALNYARDQDEAERAIAQLAHHPFERDLFETLTYWIAWSARHKYSGPYQQAVTRSALALKLCIFEPTGAIVAAPTTSLPEWIGGVRNWDYRYTWLRDSAFTLAALGQLGYYEEARNYFHFLHDLHVQQADKLRIMYSIRGESGAHLEEQTLDHLEGYRGSHPVRIGNGAATQRQMDVYGEVLDAAYSYLRHEGFRQKNHLTRPIRDLWTFASKVADYVVDHWGDLDRGIWEVRGDPQAFVYSRAMCWVALDRVCKIAQHYEHIQQKDRWATCRDALRADILTHGYNRQLGSFTQSYDSQALDASNLRLLLVRFLPPDDPMMRSTVEATAAGLAGPGGILYRYRAAGAGAGATDDGLPGQEGAFLACTFWLIGDLCYMGRVEEARERFERLLSFGGPLGLFAEEVNPETGEHLGNYPQAFTHIGLINCAVALERSQAGKLTHHPDTPTHH